MTSDTLSDCPKDPDAVLIAIQDEIDSRQLTGSVMCYYEPKGGGADGEQHLPCLKGLSLILIYPKEPETQRQNWFTCSGHWSSREAEFPQSIFLENTA